MSRWLFLRRCSLILAFILITLQCDEKNFALAADLSNESQDMHSLNSGVKDKELIPAVVTVAISPTLSLETEVIQGEDGNISIPIKYFASLFGIETQQFNEDKRLLFVDSQTGHKIEVNWGQQKIFVNDVELSLGVNTILHNKKGLLLTDDVYIDQSTFATLFNTTFALDADTTSLTFITNRKLKLPIGLSSDKVESDLPNLQIIREPEIKQSLLNKASIQQSSNYGLQESQQPINARIRSTQFNSLIDTSTVGLTGHIFGAEYTVKPSFTRFNNKFNLQNLEWYLQKAIKNNVVSLGSTDVGLSPLTSPSLPAWGLRVASKNSVHPMLTPTSNYEFYGQATSGNKVILKLNQRTVQTVTAQSEQYDLEPVYLQSQTVNEIQVIERDAQNNEKVLVEKKIGYFPNMLPKGEKGYSLFFGRAPLQFYPLLPDQNTPVFMPQTEKWMTGGRFFQGVTNRLTVGIATAGDQNFGKPKTYYGNLDPLAIDLTGFSSYLRDPNFFSGQNASISTRYQFTDHWLISSDFGMGRYTLNPGSHLPINTSGFGKAGKVRLEAQGKFFSWYLDAFHYDPNYYTPAITLYGNALYDKRGIGSGISGFFNYKVPINYNLNWSRYQTNLQENIAGGVVVANHWQGSVNAQLNSQNLLSFNYSLIDGDNKIRDLQQRNLSLAYQTKNLPWKLQGEVRASHYYSNTVFLPSEQTGTNLSEFEYLNNSLDSFLDVPLDKQKNQHLKIGHRWSNFVDYASVRAFFHFKSVFVEPFIQKSYGNKPQKLDQAGVRLGYQFKSGSRFNVSYYKLTSSFSGTDLGANSQVNSDQFAFDFSDVFGIFPHKIKSLGPNAETQGSISGTLFVDYQANKKHDSQEPGVKDIQLLIDKEILIKTDRSGSFNANGLTAGYHTLEILPNTLPLTLSTDNPIYKIKIKEGKTHQVNIPLSSEGGVLTGHLTLVDGNKRSVNPRQLILVLLNTKGQVVKYTSINEQGQYRFSNVPAGKYAVDIEEKIKNSGRYKIFAQPNEIILPIPKSYETIIEVNNLNFNLICL